VEADELSEEAALAAYADAALVATDQVVALEQQQQQMTTAVDIQSLPGVPQVQWPERDPELPPNLELPAPVKTAQSLLGEIFKVSASGIAWHCRAAWVHTRCRPGHHGHLEPVPPPTTPSSGTVGRRGPTQAVVCVCVCVCVCI
jgi:hypothetical protein